jgi:hypothetical protein
MRTVKFCRSLPRVILRCHRPLWCHRWMFNRTSSITSVTAGKTSSSSAAAAQSQKTLMQWQQFARTPDHQSHSLLQYSVPRPKHMQKWIRSGANPSPPKAVAPVQQQTSIRDAAVAHGGYHTRSRGFAAAISARRRHRSSPRTRLPTGRQGRYRNLPTPPIRMPTLLPARSRYHQPSSPHCPLRPRLAAGSPPIHPSGYTLLLVDDRSSTRSAKGTKKSTPKFLQKIERHKDTILDIDV